jgi:hypothetical protein
MISWMLVQHVWPPNYHIWPALLLAHAVGILHPYKGVYLFPNNSEIDCSHSNTVSLVCTPEQILLLQLC